MCSFNIPVHRDLLLGILPGDISMSVTAESRVGRRLTDGKHRDHFRADLLQQMSSY